LTAVRAHCIGSVSLRTGQTIPDGSRLRWSGRVWWAREELNLRPLPCQQNARNRCAEAPYLCRDRMVNGRFRFLGLAVLCWRPRASGRSRCRLWSARSRRRGRMTLTPARTGAGSGGREQPSECQVMGTSGRLEERLLVIWCVPGRPALSGCSRHLGTRRQDDRWGDPRGRRPLGRSGSSTPARDGRSLAGAGRGPSVALWAPHARRSPQAASGSGTTSSGGSWSGETGASACSPSSTRTWRAWRASLRAVDRVARLAVRRSLTFR
jgi:hypothetical protein